MSVQESREKGLYFVFLFALHPLTSVVREPPLADRYSQQRNCVLIQQLKRHFQFTNHLNSLPYTFYPPNSINLTLPSGTHHPSHCLLTPSALFSSHHFWFS